MEAAQRKKYQSQDKTVKKFLQLLETMRKCGELMLPPERVLCEKLFCSRRTLRHVLEMHESKGLIIKKGRTRYLSMEAALLTPLGKIAFIANGNGMPSNPTWNKLWIALSQMAEIEHISTKLVLIPYSANKEDCLNLLKDLPEILILTTVDNHFVKKEIHEMSQKVIITTEEDYRGMFRNIITMDNYEAGFLCAKKLAAHGYKKPAIICSELVGNESPLYIPYKKRSCGFLDGCHKFGLEINKKSEFWISGKNYKPIVKIIKAAIEINKNDFDSVFLHTDSRIDFLYEALIEESRIPKDVGVVTVNSFDYAIMHDPPVSSASSATKQLCVELIKQIKRIIETGEKTIGEIMVKPGFHKGATLK